jgi:CxxC motif-containing protein
MELVKSLSVSAPVKIGQVLVPNILGTQANLVATKTVGRD